MHAIAYIGTRRVELEDFVDPYYSVEMFRAAGRPRKRRLVGAEEDGSSNRGKRRCKRCGGFGHLQKTCNETVLDPDAPPPAPPKKRKTYKPKVVEIIETTDDPSKKKRKRKASSKGKQPKKKKATPAEPTPPEQATQYVIHLLPSFQLVYYILTTCFILQGSKLPSH